jgi:hypothetical protein
VVSSFQIFQLKFSMHLLHLAFKLFIPSISPFMQNYTCINDTPLHLQKKIQNTDTSNEFRLVLYANLFVSGRATKVCKRLHCVLNTRCVARDICDMQYILVNETLRRLLVRHYLIYILCILKMVWPCGIIIIRDT